MTNAAKAATGLAVTAVLAAAVAAAGAGTINGPAASSTPGDRATAALRTRRKKRYSAKKRCAGPARRNSKREMPSAPRTSPKPRQRRSMSKDPNHGPSPVSSIVRRRSRASIPRTFWATPGS